MGLYFQCHQEVPPELQICLAGPLGCHHDGTLHGRVRQVAHQDLS